MAKGFGTGTGVDADLAMVVVTWEVGWWFKGWETPGTGITGLLVPVACEARTSVVVATTKGFAGRGATFTGGSNEFCVGSIVIIFTIFKFYQN